MPVDPVPLDFSQARPVNGDLWQEMGSGEGGESGQGISPPWELPQAGCVSQMKDNVPSCQGGPLRVFLASALSPHR